MITVGLSRSKVMNQG